MERLLAVLAELGGFASAAQLAAAGCTRHHLLSAVRTGAVLRVRRGWFALPGAPEAEIAAVAAGGVLTCASALVAAGLWVLAEGPLHVAVPPNATARPRPGVLLHWRRWPGCGTGTASVDGIRSSVLHVLTCLPAEEAVMALDSAVNSGVIAYSDLLDLRGIAPVGKRALFDLVEPLCQSGLETRIRLAAVRIGAPVRAQVHVPGVGRLDNLIGDRLCVETDGRRFHAGSVQLEEDYRRGLALHARGFVVVRLSARQVLHEWPATEAVLASMVRQGVHRWGTRTRPLLHNEGRER
ncbi:hypothetical protein C5C18_04680 [Rathayibacter tritici]|uniref:AbiEi antitoxin N-terminal domain-containing protein n=1 Tax=Rathayibacter tritici TaxID=33888 RepID=A0A160KUF9_9MICO|nr:type IV toxin-antitoxin system AbiEi family antitoxin domain-containing protein [Rathayibacter tritici]AND16918.1 hypothetical protein A6122_1788 [Rathayibacter tritici]PPF31531.1 hypothetical protein C5C06_01935 [Rathayibacter tritici]PPF69374.1 hypothetical protein C5C21_03095 [Rathayibacter tritici]PPG08255.1 hypothetical protein C5C18_04680 [Rathayibacter tritici]PPI14126.1 hypothetical protein C5D07_08650 [Rathayibacter tritici]